MIQDVTPITEINWGKEACWESSRPTHRASAVIPQTTVLVVDDDSMMRYVLADILRHQGYRVVTAATAPEAEDVRQRLTPVSIDLAITDVHLSPDPHDWSGYGLYQCWTFAHPGIPFLLMSGDPRSHVLSAIRDGVVCCLAKPFTIETLLGVVEALLRPESCRPTFPLRHEDSESWQ